MKEDSVQPEAGGSRGCLFAALGAGCLLVLLVIFGLGGMFFVVQRSGSVAPMRPPQVALPAPAIAARSFPTGLVRSGGSVEAALYLYEENGASRMDFGTLRLEWPGQRTSGYLNSTITLATPAGDSGTSTSSFGSVLSLRCAKGVNRGVAFGTAFTIKDGILTIDGQDFSAVDGPPKVLIFDAQGKIAKVEDWAEAPEPGSVAEDGQTDTEANIPGR